MLQIVGKIPTCMTANEVLCNFLCYRLVYTLAKYFVISFNSKHFPDNNIIFELPTEVFTKFANMEAIYSLSKKMFLVSVEHNRKPIVKIIAC